MSLNLAFYGAGERARPYLDAVARRLDVTLVAVCDPDRRAAEQVAAGWGARVHVSGEAMLREVRPAALFVCVPPALQGDLLVKATEMSIPCFVEPPGAVDYAHARALGQRAAEANLVTALGFPTRFTDTVLEAREYLGANTVPLALGWWLRPAEVPAATATDLLWTDACRLVDAMRFFCGEVVRTRAVSAGATAGGLVIQLEFAQGNVGVLTCATFARPESRVELELLGEGWSLGFGEGFSSLRLAERDKTTILRCLNYPAADQATAFLEAVAGGDPATAATSYASALRTLAVCQAAVVSAREGRPVAIAEIEGAREPAGE